MKRVLSAAILILGLGASPAMAVTVEKVVSPGGIEAWLAQDHVNPIIDMEMAFKGGATQDPPNRLGLAGMVAGLLDEGAGSFDSQAFQGRLDDLAVDFSCDAGKDNFRCRLKTLTKNEDAAFDLLKLALTKPRFDPEPVERVRAQILSELARQRQDPDAIAAHTWFGTQFPNHPYGRSSQGDETSVKAMAKADFKQYVARHLTRDTLVVGVAGDITPEQLAPLLDRLFGALPAKGQGQAVSDTSPRTQGWIKVIPRDIPQSVAIFGEAGLKRDDPDWYAALVMNYILGGGGFSSWLTEEVREKRGLAYSVYSQLEPLRHTGLLVGAVATRNEKMGQSLSLIREQWVRMRDQGPTEEELEDAKTYLIGSFPLQLDSTTSVANLMVQLQMDHLGVDYLGRRDGLIRAVTREDVARAARRLLNVDALGIVVVGKPDGVNATP